jgi:hypothetical protein
MSINNYLLLAIPVVGIVLTMLALEYFAPVRPKDKIKPGE